MASRPWSDDELAVLEDYAEDRAWLEKALGELPGRSVAAARSMMQKVRSRLGMSDQRFVDGPWMVDAALASQRLLQAMIDAGVRPQ
jgi:hypothetical protein